MASITVDKVVATLPSTLEPNTAYAVRVGRGFDLYFTDSSGTPSAFRQNQRQIIQNTGRVYCYSNNRWVTDSDDNYGPNTFQWNENCGTGTTPLIEWEHMGYLVPDGARLLSFTLAGKTNNTEVTDFEVIGILRRPEPISFWESGMDNDAEDATVEVFKGSFVNGGEYTLTGNSNDFRRQRWTFDVPVVGDSMISIYLRPLGAITGTRYFRCTYAWEFEI